MSHDDQAQVAAVDGVLVPPVAGEREALAHRRRVVVVAGQHVDGHRQRLEQLADELVLGGVGVLGEIAGHHHGVRERLELEHRRDRAGERGRRALVVRPEPDVGVAELGDHVA